MQLNEKTEGEEVVDSITPETTTEIDLVEVDQQMVSALESRFAQELQSSHNFRLHHADVLAFLDDVVGSGALLS